MTVRHRAVGAASVLLLLALGLPGRAEAAALPPSWGSGATLVTDGAPPGVTLARSSPLSGDGRLVAFSSYSALVPGDDNPEADVYVRDTVTGAFTWVSVPLPGGQHAGHSSRPGISRNGRYVAFISDAPALVEGDTDRFNDVFVRDLRDGTTTRVNVSSTGAQADRPYADLIRRALPGGPAVAGDGPVPFTSLAGNLVPGDTNGLQDVFVHSLETGLTTRVSVSPSGRQLARGSDSYAAAADGSCVAFTTTAALTPGDENTTLDVYVHHLGGTTERVSAGSGGALDPSVSADCSRVSFTSGSDELSGPTGDAGKHVYVRDLLSGQLIEASLDDAGAALPGVSRRSSISGDGLTVVFTNSTGVPGVPPDRAIRSYVRDLTAGRTSLLLTGPGGSAPSTRWPVISSDGQHVSFTTPAALRQADRNGRLDVYETSR